MDKIKQTIAITIVALAFMLITGVARAGENATFSNFVQAWAKVPGAIASHIKTEVQDIKDYQTKSWSSTKTKLTGFFSDFPDLTKKD